MCLAILELAGITKGKTVVFNLVAVSMEPCDTPAILVQPMVAVEDAVP
jgi:hypothetical protein